MDSHTQEHTVEHLQYVFEQLQRFSSGISKKDLRQIGLFHSMNKKFIMSFFQKNFEFISTLSIDEIAQFLKMALFIMIEQYMLNESTRKAMRQPTFRILHSALNLDSPDEDRENSDFLMNIKSPCFNLLCLLYSKISSQMNPKTQEQYQQVKQAFIDIVNGLVPDIHYLMTEKYQAGCDERQFFFGRNQDRFETLGLFQKIFFEITSQEFETIHFLEENRIYVRTVQIFFNEIHTTLQKV
jgi:UTP-glucose-1-phosphate uridylyltransferase